MKNFKRKVSLALALILTVLSLGACKSKSTVSEYSVWEDEVVVSKSDKASSEEDSASVDKTTSRVTDSKLETAVKVATDDIKGKELTVYFPGTNAPDFVAKTIEKYEKEYNCKVTFRSGSWNTRATEIANYVNAGKSPDVIVGTVAEDYPLYASSGLLETIDMKSFDINNSKIDSATTKEVFTWNGKTFAIGAFAETEVMVYNKTLIEDMGYETPLELYRKGQWTWDAFRKLAKNMSYDTDSDGTNDVYGFTSWCMHGLHTSNNSWILKRSGNTVSLNFNDSAVKEGYQMIYEMYHTDKSVHPNGYSSLDYMKNGSAVMFMERPQRMFEIANVNTKNEFDFAPLPIGPSAGGKNYRYPFATGEAIGKGAKNYKGALVFIDMLLDTLQTQAAVGPCENSAYKYSADQKKLMEEIRTFAAAPTTALGFGKFDEKYRSIWASVGDGNIPYQTAFDSVKSAMEQEISFATAAF